jgi:hypothetical protein
MRLSDGPRLENVSGTGIRSMRPFPTVQHATIASATLTGSVGSPVSVEVHVSNGLPGFTIVGLPDAAVRESRDRVRAAILSSGLSWPLRRTVINLAPSGVRKGGAGLDLPKRPCGPRVKPDLWAIVIQYQDFLAAAGSSCGNGDIVGLADGQPWLWAVGGDNLEARCQ